MPAKCKTCSAPIIWCDTKNNKLMPVDAEPNASGDFVVVNGRTWKATEEDRKLRRELHTSHFATCAQANDHRKSR